MRLESFRVLTIAWLMVFCLMAAGNWLCALGVAQAQVQGASPSTPPKLQPHKPLDPMNRPMDELGVSGKDDTLCSDRWYSCTTYDRQQFDQKYPGRPLNELLRYGEPEWPDRHLPGSRDSFEHQDRLDNE